MIPVEQEIVQGLAGALLASATAGIAWGARKLKHIADAHLSKQDAATADSVIQQLDSAAGIVVQDFNQRIVNGAKNDPSIWTAQYQQTIKADAVQAVKDAVPNLLSLGKQVGVDVESLIPRLIEAHVAANK